MRLSFLAACCIATTSCADKQPDDWLEGRWAVDGQTCGEAWLTYHGDGTWSDFLYRGTWRRDGLNLRTSQTFYFPQMPQYRARPIAHPLCHLERLQRVGDNELRTRWEDGSVHRLVRCHPTELNIRRVGCVGDCERVTAFDERPWDPAPPAATRLCSP